MNTQPRDIDTHQPWFFTGRNNDISLKGNKKLKNGMVIIVYQANLIGCKKIQMRNLIDIWSVIFKSVSTLRICQFFMRIQI